jgi:hypothetical protein
MTSWLRWFDSLPFTQQILVSTLVFDPLGFFAGWLLAPWFGVEPFLGGVYGIIAATVPTSMVAMRKANA